MSRLPVTTQQFPANLGKFRDGNCEEIMFGAGTIG
jgi:hypothetical protein